MTLGMMILFPARWMTMTTLTTRPHHEAVIVLDQSANEASAQVSVSKLATCMITVLK